MTKDDTHRTAPDAAPAARSPELAQLKFPCRWFGSLMVAGGTPGTEQAARQVFADLGLLDSAVTPGHHSRTGRYETWKLNAMVPNLETLETLFRRLEALPGVRMLL